ncbi:MAG TPA: DinB family protein [Vicinamibacterales bacterium]|nr:DinB family protein [Vicinamibacterales bacterium]
MPESVDAFLLRHLTTRLVDEFPVQVEKCLHVLSEDDLWWRPHEQSNAVGNLVLHVAGSNRHFLEHVIGGVPFVRDRDAEFAARGGRTKADVLQVWKDVAGRVSKVLHALTPDRLAQVTREKNKSVAEVLLHVTHHNALHIGQIVWVTKLRQPGTIHELLRPASPPSR